MLPIASNDISFNFSMCTKWVTFLRVWIKTIAGIPKECGRYPLQICLWIVWQKVYMNLSQSCRKHYSCKVAEFYREIIYLKKLEEYWKHIRYLLQGNLKSNYTVPNSPPPPKKKRIPYTCPYRKITEKIPSRPNVVFLKAEALPLLLFIVICYL